MFRCLLGITQLKWLQFPVFRKSLKVTRQWKTHFLFLQKQLAFFNFTLHCIENLHNRVIHFTNYFIIKIYFCTKHFFILYFIFFFFSNGEYFQCPPGRNGFKSFKSQGSYCGQSVGKACGKIDWSLEKNDLWWWVRGAEGAGAGVCVCMYACVRACETEWKGGSRGFW